MVFWHDDLWRLQHLVLVDLAVLQLGLALLLERDDDEGHENVDEKEGEDDEKDNVENGHFDAEKGNGTFVLVGGCHGVLKDPVRYKEIRQRS